MSVGMGDEKAKVSARMLKNGLPPFPLFSDQKCLPASRTLARDMGREE